MPNNLQSPHSINVVGTVYKVRFFCEHTLQCEGQMLPPVK